MKGKFFDKSFDIDSHDFVKEYWRPKWQQEANQIQKRKEEALRRKEEEDKKYELTEQEKNKINSIIEDTLNKAIIEYKQGKPLPPYLAKKVVERLKRDGHNGINNERTKTD